MSTPSPELVDAYLTEIARAYNVEWAATRKSGQDDGPDGGFKVSPAKRSLVTFMTIVLSVNLRYRSPLRMQKRVPANQMMRRR